MIWGVPSVEALSAIRISHWKPGASLARASSWSPTVRSLSRAGIITERNSSAGCNSVTIRQQLNSDAMTIHSSVCGEGYHVLSDWPFIQVPTTTGRRG